MLNKIASNNLCFICKCWLFGSCCRFNHESITICCHLSVVQKQQRNFHMAANSSPFVPLASKAKLC